MSPPASIASVKVYVRGLKLFAEVGVHAHEYGRTQMLVADVELDVAVTAWEDPRVLRARVRIDKPAALAPDAEAAGVEIELVRG
jgi:7,8-dihydroneopterin aldolase/epimerase/oxygenase